VFLDGQYHSLDEVSRPTLLNDAVVSSNFASE